MFFYISAILVKTSAEKDTGWPET